VFTGSVTRRLHSTIKWWRGVDYSGHPALRPFGATASRCSNLLTRIILILALRVCFSNPVLFPTKRSRQICRTYGSHPPFFNSAPVLFNPETRSSTQINVWWRGVDSNHRRRSRQIYSLIPLATREPLPEESCVV
jgi:hypothetical protein